MKVLFCFSILLLLLLLYYFHHYHQRYYYYYYLHKAILNLDNIWYKRFKSLLIASLVNHLVCISAPRECVTHLSFLSALSGVSSKHSRDQMTYSCHSFPRKCKKWKNDDKEKGGKIDGRGGTELLWSSQQSWRRKNEFTRDNSFRFKKPNESAIICLSGSHKRMRIVAKHTCIRICQTSLALVICGRIYGHYLLHIIQNDTAMTIYNF